MFLRTLELEYDNIAIGSDLHTLAYSYINKIPVIYLRLQKPFKYDDDNKWKDLREQWNKLAFLLSFNNYMPFSNTISSIKIEDKTLKCVTKNYLNININFNKLYIFDDYKLNGLPVPSGKTNSDLHVIDYFNVISGARHAHELLLDNDDFVKRVVFYKSKRGVQNLVNIINKDCVSISKINTLNIDVDEYSQNYARLKTIKMMANAGIKGYYEKADNYYRKVQIESDKRKIYSLGKNIYDTWRDDVFFIYDEYDTILKQQEVTDEYMDYIKHVYGITT